MATLELLIDGVEPALSVRRFEIRESASEVFTIAITACSPRVDLDLDDVILRPASFSIASGWAFVRNGGRRSFTGLCSSIEQLQAEVSGLSTYRLRIVPRLWLLTLRENYRIFQHASIPDIATRLLDEFSIAHAWRIDRSAFPRLNYKVQYGESDFAFLCRLCEEAGITFTFEESDTEGSVLVLSDAPCAVTPRNASPLPYVDNPNEAAEKEFVTRVRKHREARSGAFALRDYDFRNPSLALFAQASGATQAEALLEHYRYEPGAFRVIGDVPSSTPVADMGGVAHHDPRYGRALADRLLLGERAGALGVAFETNAMDLAPGTVFSMAGHPHPKLDESHKLFVTQLAIEGEHDKEWTTRGSAVFADVPYQPPRRTKKPVVHGLQSAVVTGPKDREIFTDEHGRVHVQFPWDREGKGDEKSSCWIRVSQGWAGAGFGLWTLPRVGQEVLIGFLAGDPDEPIIVGRAPNTHNPPPYPLPAHETRTVWRSRSTPGADGFNEISFEDKGGEERFYERAEKDKESLIKNDERLAIGRNRQKLVKSDEDAAVLHTRRQLVGGDDHHTVKGDRREHVEGSYSLIIDGDLHISVGGRLAIAVRGEAHISSGANVVIEGADVTNNAGGGFVRVTGGGVVIDGSTVLIKQGGSPGIGSGSNPAEPDTPTIPAAFIAQPLPSDVRRLPLLGFRPPFLMNLGVGSEREIICRAICACDGAHNGTQRVSQWCVTLALWEYDKALSNQSTIKADVPFDTSKNPPVPIMSKNDPTRPKHKKDAGTEAPDVIVVHDGTKPPTQGNIKKVYEIKFGDDELDEKKEKAYRKIAGAAEFEVLTPDECGCSKKEADKLPEPMSAKEAALLALLLLAFVAAVLDGVPGDEVGVGAGLGKALARLWPRLAPILLPLLFKLTPVNPPPMLPPR
jgi:type VI secretion system secreted protein VgrG